MLTDPRNVLYAYHPPIPRPSWCGRGRGSYTAHAAMIWSNAFPMPSLRWWYTHLVCMIKVWRENLPAKISTSNVDVLTPIRGRCIVKMEQHCSYITVANRCIPGPITAQQYHSQMPIVPGYTRIPQVSSQHSTDTAETARWWHYQDIEVYSRQAHNTTSPRTYQLREYVTRTCMYRSGCTPAVMQLTSQTGYITGTLMYTRGQRTTDEYKIITHQIHG